MRAIRCLSLVTLLSLSTLSVPAAETWNTETAAERDARMEWWREARFGMFIHWGLYAVPAGKWNDKPVGGIGEWIMDKANIPIKDYETLPPTFNPVNYDADEWVRIAKKAGMKYIVITSKHHDGFALFDSKVTDWDVVDRTPYKKDLLTQLSAACKKHGLKFCTYYSIMDWHHPAQYRGSEKRYNPTKIHADRKEEYMTFMKQQLKELIDTCDPEVLWFDGEWPAWYTEEDGRDVYTFLRELKPSLIVNNRVGKGRKGMEGLNKGDQEYVGDFGTPEQQIPATGLAGVDWESCMTMNRTWGFKADDHNWKTTEMLTRNVIDTAAKGGNYLLNVGPTADGLIPAPSVERLAGIGRWMDKNSESIYATQASPFEQTPWGKCTRKTLDNGNTRLYLHVFDWPKDKLVVPELTNEPVQAYLLDGGKKLNVTKVAGAIDIALPAEMPDKTATVVVLDIQGKPKIAKTDPYEDETEAERNARMKWWRDARFGMFIHWGVYAVPAGTYKGKRIGGIGEWIMRRAQIPVDEYRAFAQDFNPVKYDADAWVRLAKEAGMKYIVITAKHHDGFALFDSNVTDWDIADATPYKKDLLKPLAEACKKHGLKIGFYYSQAQDWTHPGGAKSGMKEGQGWDEKHKGSFNKYLADIAYPQVKEILTGYDIDVLWWDTPTWMTKERASKLLPLINHRPGIIVNNRLGGGYSGDTDTPEQHIPATGIPGRDWETCMTMNGTWGFKSYDHNWKPVETLVRNLVDIASKGGNYLLNVGPTKEGLIPGPSIERLKAVGQWMKVNGDAIYETSASPFKKLAWGRATKKLRAGGATLYLHVFDWPEHGKLKVPGLKNTVKSAYLLSGEGNPRLTTTSSEEGVTVNLTGPAPDPICSVVTLVVDGELDIQPVLIAQAEDGSVKLPAREGVCHGKEIKYESGKGRDNIGFWLNPADWVEFPFKLNKPGVFKASVEVASLGSGMFTLQVDGQKLQAKAPNTGDYGKFRKMELGELTLDSAGKKSIAIRAVKKGWKPFNLKSLRLEPKS